MSTYYKIEIDLSRHTQASTIALIDRLAEEGVQISGEYAGDDEIAVNGHVTLTDGEHPEQAHERFERALGVKLNSRWLDLDNTPWDFEIDNLTPEEEED